VRGELVTHSGGVLRELATHRADLLSDVDGEVIEDGERRLVGGVSGEDAEEAEAECLTAAGDSGDGSEADNVCRGPIAGRGPKLEHAE